MEANETSIDEITSLGYEPEQIANWILAQFDPESGDAVTHLKLQKLLYYIQAWVLADHKESLFDEDFEAWTHGPVLPSIYRKYKDRGFNTILDFGEIPEFKDDTLVSTMKEVIDVYGEHTAKYLEKLAKTDGAYIKAIHDKILEINTKGVIAKEGIRDYYSNIH